MYIYIKVFTDLVPLYFPHFQGCPHCSIHFHKKNAFSGVITFITYNLKLKEM